MPQNTDANNFIHSLVLSLYWFSKFSCVHSLRTQTHFIHVPEKSPEEREQSKHCAVWLLWCILQWFWIGGDQYMLMHFSILSEHRAHESKQINWWFIVWRSVDSVKWQQHFSSVNYDQRLLHSYCRNGTRNDKVYQFYLQPVISRAWATWIAFKYFHFNTLSVRWME